MKEIYQLTSEEYHEMKKYSDLNKKQIEKRAIELYEEKGLARIEIDLPENDYSGEYHYPIKIKARCFNKRYSNNNVIDIDNREMRKAVKYIRDNVDKYILKRCGTYFEWEERLRKKEQWQINMIRAFLIFTITGWFLSVIMVLIVLLK